MSVLIIGASGFVGQNLLAFCKSKNILTETLSLRNKKLLSISTEAKVIVHLAGKAHDLKKTSNHSEYYEVNTELTKWVYQAFCDSNADTFIYMSSVKAVSDSPREIINEKSKPSPITAYGKSKLAAEEYLIQNQKAGTRLYILRPCMIHGPKNKGNLNLLYSLVKKGVPYPLGSFSNKRSFLTVGNLNFVINELIQNTEIKSGVYNVSDDEAFSSVELVRIIGTSLNKRVAILSPPIFMINIFAKIGDILMLPLTTERLEKLTENYIVSNAKIKLAIGKELPINGKVGLLKTFNSFQIK